MGFNSAFKWLTFSLNDTVEQVIELVYHGKEFYLISMYDGEEGGGGGKNSNICNIGKGKHKFN
jgi:hypothetical protein